MKLAMFGPWNASVVTVRKYIGLPAGRYCSANFGLVMSGLVELGVIVARSPWLRMGDIALPAPLICGPSEATTSGSDTIFRALVAAWAGSYWPEVAVPSSSVIS